MRRSAANAPVRHGRDDAAAAGPSAVLATTFEAEILPLAPSSEAGADLAEGGDEAEGAAPSPGDA